MVKQKQIWEATNCDVVDITCAASDANEIKENAVKVTVDLEEKRIYRMSAKVNLKPPPMNLSCISPPVKNVNNVLKVIHRAVACSIQR